MNLGQVLRHLRYLTDLPDTPRLEALKQRLRWIANDLYYTVTPGQWHHTQAELDELSKYSYTDLLKMGFDPDFADEMLGKKPLLEEWSPLAGEAEGSIAKQNFELLLHGPEKNRSNFTKYQMTISELVPFDKKLEEFLSDLIEEIPQLRNHKIKRFLGAGTKGVVFELDSGRALKIYEYSYQEDQEGFYDNESGKIFSGSGKIMTLPIFDRGETYFGIKYVEMAKVLPFDLFLMRTGRKQLNSRLYGWLDIIGKLIVKIKENPDNMSTVRQYQEMLLKFNSEAHKNNLTEHEISSLFNMVEYVVTNYGPFFTDDLFEENFGVLEQTMSSETPIFVLFDP